VTPRTLRRAAAAALLSALACALAGCGAGGHPTTTAASHARAAARHGTATELYGLAPEPMPRKPDVTLTDTAGRPFNLVSATRGKLTYLYFGYTHCPDACPATMSEVSASLRLDASAIRRRIAVVFVTVDPRRDTASVLRTWLDHYGTSFVGLRGTPSEVAAAEEAAGVPPAPRAPGKGADYSVSHSSVLFAYSPDGLAHVIYSQGFTPAEYAHDASLLLRFTGT
jgi:protein SCO1/2